MNAHEILFAFGYVLNMKLHPRSASPAWASCFGMSLSIGLNIYSIVAITAIITGNRSLFSPMNTYGLAMFAAVFCLCYYLFIRNRRYEDVMKRYEALTIERRRKIWMLGISHLVITIVCSIGSLALLPN
jgi:uncharacterized membrane protein